MLTKSSNYATLIMPNQLNIKRGRFSFCGKLVFLSYLNCGFDKNADPVNLSVQFALYIELVWRLSGFAFFVRLLRWSHFLFFRGRSMKKIVSLLLITGLLLSLAVPMGVGAATEGGFTYSVYAGKATITEYTGKAANLVIPVTLGGYPVTTIGKDAFQFCYSLTSVTIPNSVTTIGEYAFDYCHSLTSVTIGDSVTTIGKDAFAYCDSLTSVTIPNSVTTIGDQAFEFCDSLTSVTIPDSVATIGGWAFFNCHSLTSVTIGDSVTTIGDWAFADCNSLTSVTMGDSVTTIRDRAFSGCDSLTSVTIPNSVTTIGDYAFEGCDSLTSVTIGDSVTTIGDYAFPDGTELIRVAIPDNWWWIGLSVAFLLIAVLAFFIIRRIVKKRKAKKIAVDNGMAGIEMPVTEAADNGSDGMGEPATEAGEPPIPSQEPFSADAVCYCGKCGTQNKKAAQFCKNCGNPLHRK